MNNSTKAVYEELLRIAKNDNVVSNDEEILINNIMENVNQYYSILDESNQDGIINSGEHHDLHFQRKKILEEAISQAKNDDQVTKEEFNILMGLRRIIANMEHQE